jgi:GntR family transcriptional regulator
MTDLGMPKYKVIHQALLNRLRGGYYSVGVRLPTEEALAKSFDASRITVRRSLDMLVSEGYLVARQGSGYTVATLSPPSSMCMTSFTDSVLNDGREPGARLVDIRVYDGDAPAGIQKMFNEPITCIIRLRTIDGAPKMLVHTWVPTRLVPDASAADFPDNGQNQSILRILTQRFGLDWSSARETIRPSAALPEIATLLDVEPNTPILSQACMAYDKDQKIVFSDEVYRQTPITYHMARAERQGAGHTKGTEY